MSTFSVFRRNQKVWIAVLGVLTMLSFVFIPTLQQCSGRYTPGSQVVFSTKLFGNLSGSKFETIRQQQTSVSQVLYGSYFRGLDAQSVAGTWLKARFAEKYGFVVADAEIREFIRNAFESKEAYEDALKRNRMTSASFEEGLQDLILASKYENYCLAAIGRQMNWSGMPVGISAFPQTIQQQWDFFCMVYRNAMLEVVPVRAEDFLAQVPAPTAEQVEKYFEAGKETLANAAAGVIGFKVPRKMRLQYFVYTKPVTPAPAETPAPVAKPENVPESIQLDEAAPALTEEAKPAEEAAPAPVEEAKPAEEAAPAPVEEAKPAEEAAPAEQPQASNVSNPFRFVADETVTIEPAPEAAPAEVPATEAAPAEETKPAELETEPEEKYDSKAFTKLVQTDLSAHKAAVSRYEFNKTEGMEEPKLEFSAETKAYMEKFGIKFVELELMDVNALAKETISQAWNSNLLGAKTFMAVECEDLANNYVAWNAEFVPEETPELTEEVKKEVVAAWKLERAKELAAEAAEASAKAASEAKAFTGTVSPVTVEDFARCKMTVEGQPTAAPLEDYAQLENIAEDFRTAVFEMVPGEVKALPNRNRTIYYVTMLKKFSPEDAEMYEMFKNIKGNQQFAQMAMMQRSAEVNSAIQQWQISVFEDAGASFVGKNGPDRDEY